MDRLNINVCSALLNPSQITEDIILHISTCEEAMITAGLISSYDNQEPLQTPISYTIEMMVEFIKDLSPKTRHNMIEAIQIHGLYTKEPFEKK
jgi:hypothetical protein